MTDPFIPKKVITRAQAEASVSVWICSAISSYADDVRTRCADCTCPIVHRPHAARNSTKLCMPCARIRYGLSMEKEPTVITEDVMRDLIARRKL